MISLLFWNNYCEIEIFVDASNSAKPLAAFVLGGFEKGGHRK